MRLLFAITALVCLSASYLPAGDPTFTKAKRHHNRYDATLLYGDILDHAPEHKWYNDPQTTAHEATHHANNFLRNLHSTDVKRVGLYVGNGNAVIIDEPTQVRLGSVAAYVPKNLRGDKFQLYLIDQASTGWATRPLYLLDEWVSYTNEAQVMLEEYRRQNKKFHTHYEVTGCTEFLGYAAALCLAIKENDPRYWKSPAGQQLRDFVAWNGTRSLALYAKLQKLDAKDLPVTPAVLNDKKTLDFLLTECGMNLPSTLLEQSPPAKNTQPMKDRRIDD